MKAKKRAKRKKFNQVVSTNAYAKEQRAFGRDLIVTAKRQTGGKGTKGRSFVSTQGGIYLTYLRFLENMPAQKAFCIMASAAVAVCKTLESVGLQPTIKWANDIHVGGKKICGILTENTISGEVITSSLIGIGVNIHNSLPHELDDIATTVYQQTGKKYSVEKITRRLIKNLNTQFSVEEYRSYLGYMGRRAELVFGDERVPATLLFVDDEGGLTVEIDGKSRRFTAAEVSVIL